MRERMCDTKYERICEYVCDRWEVGQSNRSMSASQIQVWTSQIQVWARVKWVTFMIGVDD